MRSRKHRLRKHTTNDAALFQQVFRSTDAGHEHLRADQTTIECASRPFWYADPGADLQLKPIQIDTTETVDASDTWLEEKRNTVQFRLGRKGAQVYTFGPHFLRLRFSRYCGEPVPAPMQTRRTDAAGIEQDYPDENLSIRQTIQPGKIKEDIYIASAPAEFQDSYLRLVWRYSTASLIPTLENDAILWRDRKGELIFILEPPTARDANGKRMEVVYRLNKVKSFVAVDIHASELQGKQWPITIDPSVTTDQSDVTANRSIEEDDGNENFEDVYSTAFVLIALPDLTGFSSIDVGTFQAEVLTYNAGTSPLNNIDTWCDITSAWSESSSRAVLNALTGFTSITDSGDTINSTGTKTYNVLGAVGVNGLRKIYGDDASPAACTVKLDWDQIGYTEDNAQTVFKLGEETGIDDSEAIFAPRTDATNYQRIAITYTMAALPPTSEFSADDVTPDVSQVVVFTDLSNDNGAAITDWAWTFGDGDTSTLQDPNHKYLSTGTYTVSLTTTNANGSDTETKVDYITVSAVAQSTQQLSGNIALPTVRYSTNGGSSFTSATQAIDVAMPEGGTDPTEFTHTDLTDNHRIFKYGWSDGGEVSWTFNYTEALYSALLALVETELIWSVEWSDPTHTVTNPERRFTGFIMTHPTVNPPIDDRQTLTVFVKVTGKAEFFQGN